MIKGWKSSFLFHIPNASELTELLGPLFLFKSLAGRSST
jgi:hypothetical protein